MKNDLFDLVIPVITGKDVLDIGCVNHNASNSENDPFWIHGVMKKYSKTLVGIDIDKEGVEFFKKKGYDLKEMNAESFSLNKKFDIIFAGDVIEHLSNPGLFLGRARTHLKKKGFLIISTPNTFNLANGIKDLLTFNTNPSENPQHTFYFSLRTLKELLSRNGFIISRVAFVNHYKTYKGKIRYVLYHFLGDNFQPTMVVFCKLK